MAQVQTVDNPFDPSSPVTPWLQQQLNPSAVTPAILPASLPVATTSVAIPTVPVPNPLKVLPLNNANGTSNQAQVANAVNTYRTNIANDANGQTPTALPLGNGGNTNITYQDTTTPIKLNLQGVPLQTAYNSIMGMDGYTSDQKLQTMQAIANHATAMGIGTSASASGVDIPNVQLLPMNKNSPLPVVKAVSDPNNSIPVRTAANNQTNSLVSQAVASTNQLPLLNQASANNLGANSSDPNSAIGVLGQQQLPISQNLSNSLNTYHQQISNTNSDGSVKSTGQQLSDAMGAQNTRRLMEIESGLNLQTAGNENNLNSTLAGAIVNNKSMVADPASLIAEGTLGVNQQNSNISNTQQDINRAMQANSSLQGSTQTATGEDNAATQRAIAANQAYQLQIQEQEDLAKQSQTNLNPDATVKVAPELARAIGLVTGKTVDPNANMQQTLAQLSPDEQALVQKVSGAGGAYGTDIYSAYQAATNPNSPLAIQQQAAPYAALIQSAKTNVANSPAGQALGKQLAKATGDVNQTAAIQGQLDNLYRSETQRIAAAAASGDPTATSQTGGLYGTNVDNAVPNGGTTFRNGASLPQGVTTQLLKSTGSVDLLNTMDQLKIPLVQQSQVFANLASSSNSNVDFKSFSAPNPQPVFNVTLKNTGRVLNLASPAGLAQYNAYRAAQSSSMDPSVSGSIVQRMLGNTSAFDPNTASTIRTNQQSGTSLGDAPNSSITEKLARIIPF